ncbi:CRISPR-associated protein Cas7/Csh2, subtype I-B/HMARI [Methanoregula formicica SMSP]|uniref:CRISPR-associated protein Cas7/Csh2, subtype I-B/HMARI n=2 Tax=Methanoregula formicica TaxID=882104 RepID=L0HJD7_METFS|nr:CRISPR-associated protein Cas7/Csh2, subtype I-B/HMARI [Methanoregula formicica SMSP]
MSKKTTDMSVTAANVAPSGKTMTEKVTIANNHEILFVYDAKMCNPNGDPDNENKPRMDPDREINLVSDLRLKRYIRDYFEQYLGEPIFVCNIDGRSVTSTGRLEELAREKNMDKADLLNDDKFLMDNLMDVRFFGATMTIKGSSEKEEKAGSKSTKSGSKKFTGPVQFNWGYSLNKVNIMESSGITSHFSSEAGNKQGAMGKDYRVDYSLIAFHGIISAKRAEHTSLTDKDIELFDQAIVNSIPLMATRTKIGQYPRLYLRIEYNSPEFFLGDLRKYISISHDPKIPIRYVSDYTLDVSKLKTLLEDNKDKIKSIKWWVSPEFHVKDGEITKQFEKLGMEKLHQITIKPIEKKSPA